MNKKIHLYKSEPNKNGKHFFYAEFDGKMYLLNQKNLIQLATDIIASKTDSVSFSQENKILLTNNGIEGLLTELLRKATSQGFVTESPLTASFLAKQAMFQPKFSFFAYIQSIASKVLSSNASAIKISRFLAFTAPFLLGGVLAHFNSLILFSIFTASYLAFNAAYFYGKQNTFSFSSLPMLFFPKWIINTTNEKTFEIAGYGITHDGIDSHSHEFAIIDKSHHHPFSISYNTVMEKLLGDLHGFLSPKLDDHATYHFDDSYDYDNRAIFNKLFNMILQEYNGKVKFAHEDTVYNIYDKKDFRAFNQMLLTLSENKHTNFSRDIDTLMPTYSQIIPSFLQSKRATKANVELFVTLPFDNNDMGERTKKCHKI